VHETVDDGIDAAVAHRQPVHGRVDEHEEVFLRDRLVDGELRLEVGDEDERVQRQPADGEHRHHDYQHLYHLHTLTSNSYSTETELTFFPQIFPSAALLL